MLPETLSGLLEHYSPSGQEHEAVTWLVEHMASLGYTRSFIDDAGNAVGVLGYGPKQLVLLGHIDTVPGEIPLHLEGDLLYGRGSVDAKGPLACFVDAAARLGAQETWQIVVIGAVEEERSSEGARYVASRYHPDYAVIGEPNHWDRIALGYKGSAWADLTVRAAQSHTASQQESACEAAVRHWSTLQGWAESFNTDRKRAFDRLLLTLRGMDSGDDGFEQWARLRIGARLPLDFPPRAWYERLKELANPAQVDPIGHALPAYQCEKNTPLVRALLAGIRSQGGTPSFVYKTGTADLNTVAPVWQCPSLVYGPGDSALDHTPAEHISLAEYRKALDSLETALRMLLS